MAIEWGYSDLALERRELYREGSGREVAGVKVDVQSGQGAEITRVEILDAQGARAMGKPVGTYITLEAPDLALRDNDIRTQVGELVAQQLTSLLPRQGCSALVVGLGNRQATPDALGPMTLDKVLVTRHLFELMPHLTDQLCSVAALTPGVMGLTGIESVDMVRAVARKIKPEVVILIDALVSRRANRISTTIQLSDTGLHPGAGVGNQRKRLDQKTLGCPVIAVGIPTVVYAATITWDAIRGWPEYAGQDEEQLHQHLQRVVTEALGPLVVTPKEIDQVVSDSAQLLAHGINRALQPHLSQEEIAAFLL
ncbi:MAG: GPR endopeptidase [Christensenellales bacterium]